jgi:hypothetical protein
MSKGLMMDKPNSAATDATIAAAKKYAADPRLADRLTRKAYGDGLDRLSLRDSAHDLAPLLLLVFAGAMYAFGEIPFAWQSGHVVLPGLREWGGVVLVANSLIFILLVLLYIADGRPFFARKERRNRITGEVIVPGTRGNSWSIAMAATCVLALFAIYTAQTTAADEVRKAVAQREEVARDVVRLTAEIRDALIPNRRSAELAMEQAQDLAVGAGLNTLTPGEANILCADVAGFEDKITCRQKFLRASIDCTQSTSVMVRENACGQIKAAEIQISRIEEEEARQAQRQLDLAAAKAKLDAMPPASNSFVLQIADMSGWSIPDAQSRSYIAIALICLLIPAIIFAKVLVRREDPPPAQTKGG